MMKPVSTSNQREDLFGDWIKSRYTYAMDKPELHTTTDPELSGSPAGDYPTRDRLGYAPFARYLAHSIATMAHPKE